MVDLSAAVHGVNVTGTQASTILRSTKFDSIEPTYSIERSSVSGVDNTSFAKGVTRLLFPNIVLPWSVTGSAISYSTLSYAMEGINSLIEVKKDEEALSWNLQLIDNMMRMATRTTTRPGVERFAWTKGPVGAQYEDEKEIGTYNAATEIARTASLVFANPVWNASYGEKMRGYLAIIQDMVMGRYFQDQYGGVLPWLSEKNWNPKAGYFGAFLAAMYQATRQTLFLDLAKQLGENFKTRLQPNGTGWIWDNGTIAIGSQKSPSGGTNDVGNQEGVPDTQLAGASVKMMVYMHEAGLVFDRTDVGRMANTLTDTMWNGDMFKMTFSNYINGSQKAFRTRSEPGSNGYIGMGWALLGRYSQKAQPVIQRFFSNHFGGSSGGEPPTATASTRAHAQHLGAVISLGGATGRFLLDAFAVTPVRVVAFNNVAGEEQQALSPGTLIRLQLTSVPASLKVKVAGIDANVVSREGNDIIIVVPDGIPFDRSGKIELFVDGLKAGEQAVDFLPVAPSVFQDGVFNQDWKKNSNSAQAQTGSVVQIFATGIKIPEGWKIYGKIHDREYLEPTYSGPTSYDGVQQFNLPIPEDLPSMTTEVNICAVQISTGRQICSHARPLVIVRPD